MTDFENLIRALGSAEVDFIIVGGIAAAAHGSARQTIDLDVVYSRTPDNIGRIVKALLPLNPYLRGAPPGLPFEWSERTILSGLNFTLQTNVGAVDLLGEIVGGGGYRELLPYSTKVVVFGVNCRVLNLEQLILVKRAAGRPKDLESIAELELILSEQQKKK